MNIEKIARALAMANGHPDVEQYVARVKEIYALNEQAESDAMKAHALESKPKK